MVILKCLCASCSLANSWVFCLASAMTFFRINIRFDLWRAIILAIFLKWTGSSEVTVDRWTTRLYSLMAWPHCNVITICCGETCSVFCFPSAWEQQQKKRESSLSEAFSLYSRPKCNPYSPLCKNVLIMKRFYFFANRPRPSKEEEKE